MKPAAVILRDYDITNLLCFECAEKIVEWEHDHWEPVCMETILGEPLKYGPYTFCDECRSYICPDQKNK
jgi:hypothetical protein